MQNDIQILQNGKNVRDHQGNSLKNPNYKKEKDALTIDFIDATTMLARAAEGKADFEFIRHRLYEILEHLEERGQNHD